MTYDNYVAQQVQYNLTIQNTVAASMDGVTPDRVTNIVVGQVPAARAASRLQSAASAAVTDQQVNLKYTVKVYDPVLTVEGLRNQLVRNAASGAMDADLHHYAMTMGVTNLVNGTFSAPLVTSPAVARVASSQLTGAMIAGLVIGVILFLGLLIVLVLFIVKRSDGLEEEAPKHRAMVESA